MTPEDVRRIREGLGMSGADFGYLVGVSRQHVHNWETGKRSVTRQVERHMDLIVTLAEMLQGYQDIFQVKRIGFG